MGDVAEGGGRQRRGPGRVGRGAVARRSGDWKGVGGPWDLTQVSGTRVSRDFGAGTGEDGVGWGLARGPGD